jgi:hypothetical protein
MGSAGEGSGRERGDQRGDRQTAEYGQVVPGGEDADTSFKE